MPRALISYFFRPDSIPLGFSCSRSLERLGWEVENFHSQVEHPLERHGAKYVNRLLRGLSGGRWSLPAGRGISNHRYRERLLEARVARFRPDLLLVIRGNSYSREFLDRIKREYGIARLVGWWVKDPRDGAEVIEDAKSYDSYFCIHRQGDAPGEPIHFLPATAVDRELYPVAKRRDGEALTHGLVQVGGYGARRHRFLAACKGLPLEIYGPGWRKGRRFLDPLLRAAWAGSGIWGDALVRLYHASRIVVNVTNWDPSLRTGQNLRIMDVPATGAFLLTDECEEVRNLFDVGSELDTFSSPEELADKARHYLANPGERETMARRGYERTLTFPTYDDRMKELLCLAWGKDAAPPHAAMAGR